jgi:hypothetical protein
MTLSKQHQQQIEWRRNQVLDFLSKGFTQSNIATILKIDKSVISRDVFYLRQQSKENIKKYVDERLPDEYEMVLVGLSSILKEMWSMSYQSDIDRREKIQALSLAKECYSMKLELLTNATVIGDAVRFVTSHQQQQQQKKNQDQQQQNQNQQSSSSSTEEEEQSEEQEEDETVEISDRVF